MVALGGYPTTLDYEALMYHACAAGDVEAVKRLRTCQVSVLNTNTVALIACISTSELRTGRENHVGVHCGEFIRQQNRYAPIIVEDWSDGQVSNAIIDRRWAVGVS